MLMARKTPRGSIDRPGALRAIKSASKISRTQKPLLTSVQSHRMGQQSHYGNGVFVGEGCGRNPCR
jgi:hypothetical protein